jgi:hypothetical protein
MGYAAQCLSDAVPFFRRSNGPVLPHALNSDYVHPFPFFALDCGPIAGRSGRDN